MPKAKWQKIEDKHVRSLWTCSECADEVWIGPSWYQQNGTPMCIHCDVDMEYTRTEVRR